MKSINKQNMLTFWVYFNSFCTFYRKNIEIYRNKLSWKMQKLMIWPCRFQREILVKYKKITIFLMFKNSIFFVLREKNLSHGKNIAPSPKKVKWRVSSYERKVRRCSQINLKLIFYIIQLQSLFSLKDKTFVTWHY